MKYSKLLVAGAAALALGGCYSLPVDSFSPEGVSAPAPVGYNSSPGRSDTTVSMAGDAKPEGTGTYETRAEGNANAAK